MQLFIKHLSTFAGQGSIIFAMGDKKEIQEFQAIEVPGSVLLLVHLYWSSLSLRNIMCLLKKPLSWLLLLHVVLKKKYIFIVLKYTLLNTWLAYDVSCLINMLTCALHTFWFISTFLLDEYFSIPVTVPILIIQWDSVFKKIVFAQHSDWSLCIDVCNVCHFLFCLILSSWIIK